MKHPADYRVQLEFERVGASHHYNISSMRKTRTGLNADLSDIDN